MTTSLSDLALYYHEMQTVLLTETIVTLMWQSLKI